MAGENDGQPGGDLVDRLQDHGQGVRRVHVARAVEGEQPVGSGDEAQALGEPELPCAVPMPQEGIHHDVSHEEDLLRGDALPKKVGPGGGLAREQEVGEVVGEGSIHLFRHGPIEAAKASLHVRERDPRLGAHEGAGQRRVDVPVDDDEGRTLTQNHLLEPHHDLGGLGGVRAGPDAQVQIGLRQTQLVEEDTRQGVVVVLVRVDQPLFPVASPAEGLHHRRRLHEVRACAHDAHDLDQPEPPVAGPAPGRGPRRRPS